MKENKNNSMAFSLIGIKAEQFAVFEENYLPDNDILIDSEIQFKANTHDKRLGISLIFSYKSEKNTFIHLQTSCHFQIEEKSWDSCITYKSISFPLDFTMHLAMIAVGASRGILYEKMQGGPLDHFLLPLLDVSQLAGKQVVFELD